MHPVFVFPWSCLLSSSDDILARVVPTSRTPRPRRDPVRRPRDSSPLTRTHFRRHVPFDGLNRFIREFVSTLAQYHLRYCEVSVDGGCWLQDTPWNWCLGKCTDHLEKFRVHRSESEGEEPICRPGDQLFSNPVSRLPKGLVQTVDFR